MSKLFLVGVASLLVWVGGCATQADLQQTLREQSSLRSLVADQKAALEDTRRQVEKVRGEVEEIRHHLERAARRAAPSSQPAQSPQLKALEERVTTLERWFAWRTESPSPLTGEKGAELPQPVPPEEKAVPAAKGVSREEAALALEPLAAQEEYRAALRAMREQQFDKAIQAFRSFAQKYPRSEMADDARYWIGECYYAQRKYYEAILAYNDVLRDYEHGDRVPAALLRQASAFTELGNKIDARVTLQTLIRRYPGTPEAEEAKKTLQTLGG